VYYSAIGLLAALILIIENQDIFINIRKSFQKPAWELYRRFLFAVLTYYVTDILWGILESRKLAGALFADTTVYFAAMAVGVLFWVRFSVAYLDEKSAFGQFLVYAGRIVAGLIAVLAVVNIFLPVLFTVDADCVYQALPLRYAILGAQVLLLLLISGYALSLMVTRPEESGKHCLTIALFGFIMALFLTIQIWFPLLPLYSIAYMLGTSLLHTVVVNEEKEEYRQGLKEAEKIAELKQTISSLLDNMPGINYTKDAETGVYLACNQAFAEFARKKSPEGVIGMKPTEIFDPVTAGKGAEEDRIALAMDGPYTFFEDALDAGGNPRQLQTTKLKYVDASGRLCILGMSQDVTDMIRIRRENAMTKEAYDRARSNGVIYTHIAQTLARGFKNLFYVNLDSEEFIEYQTDTESGSLKEKRRGYHFFEECQTMVEENVYPDDREAVQKALDRKTLEAALDRDGIFAITYRMLQDGRPIYVTLNASRMVDDNRTVILGLRDVDEQIRERRAAELIMEEQVAYTRLSALTGDFLAVYVVDPETDRYREFASTQDYESLEQAKEGQDFFTVTREAAKKVGYPEDVNRVLTAFTKENVMTEVGERGIFTLSYRIMMRGEPLYVQLKAAMVEEREGKRLIVGISDIDAQVRQEEKYVTSISKARMEANIDPLTGVKNRHAFLVAEERLNGQIAENDAKEFAVVILDVNDLKKVNDNEGHAAGDQHIRDACKIICELFKHSPVFRLGGDEFAVIAQGSDYACIEDLVEQMRARNAEAKESGGIVIACGMAKREDDTSVAPVFERADQNMYEDKNRLKNAD
jgi:diguanylate cyclase (GGDEF)-like protein